MARFIANRAFTSLRAIYTHYSAKTKSERETARNKAYGSLRRSEKGRANIARIEKRRASARQAAETRRTKKEQEKHRTPPVIDITSELEEDEYYDSFPDIEPRYDRTYSQPHAYVIELHFVSVTDSPTGPVGQSSFQLVTFLYNEPQTVGQLDRDVWDSYGQDAMYPDTYGEELVDWRLIAYYITRPKENENAA